jgi:hypothetical protein
MGRINCLNCCPACDPRKPVWDEPFESLQNSNCARGQLPRAYTFSANALVARQCANSKREEQPALRADKSAKITGSVDDCVTRNSGKLPTTAIGLAGSTLLFRLSR